MSDGRSGFTAGIVARRELLEIGRDGRARALLVAVLILLGVTLAFGLARHHHRTREVTRALSLDRQLWEAQGARNPHSAAHFGQYAFKPSGALSAFDPGLDSYLGRAVWMEAHIQNTATFRPAEDRRTVGFAHELSAAYLLQALAPLLLIFLGHGMLAAERERRTLRLSLSSGVDPGALVAGKLLALTSVGFAIWFPATVVLLITTDSADARLRALVLSAGYAVYLFTICALVVFVSARAKTARGALTVLLAGWIAAVLVLPRVASEVGERAYPNVDSRTFWREVHEGTQKAPGGHGADDAPTRVLLAETLKKHGVARKEDLPISFAGVALEAEERFNRDVFDAHFGELEQSQVAQRRLLRALSLLTPTLAVRMFSAGIAGTDAHHHWKFVRRAEDHRRAFITVLNDDFEKRAGNAEFTYLAEPSLWKRVPAFSYAPPTLRDTAAAYASDAGLIVVWLVAGLAAVALSARRLRREEDVT